MHLAVVSSKCVKENADYLYISEPRTLSGCTYQKLGTKHMLHMTALSLNNFLWSFNQGALFHPPFNYFQDKKHYQGNKQKEE